jgi:hypothetical protein
MTYVNYTNCNRTYTTTKTLLHALINSYSHANFRYCGLAHTQNAIPRQTGTSCCSVECSSKKRCHMFHRAHACDLRSGRSVCPLQPSLSAGPVQVWRGSTVAMAQLAQAKRPASCAVLLRTTSPQDRCCGPLVKVCFFSPGRPGRSMTRHEYAKLNQ